MVGSPANDIKSFREVETEVAIEIRKTIIEVSKFIRMRLENDNVMAPEMNALAATLESLGSMLPNARPHRPSASVG
jgi:hypothetical protein